MLVRAVTKAWQDSLDGPPSIGRVYQPKPTGRPHQEPSMGWHRPAMDHAVHHADGDAQADNSEVRAHKQDPIVPIRRGAPLEAPDSQGLRKSYEFWMGIVVGAGAVLVVKTVLAVQAPFGVTWY